jgi:hypothetical protein
LIVIIFLGGILVLGQGCSGNDSSGYTPKFGTGTGESDSTGSSGDEGTYFYYYADEVCQDSQLLDEKQVWYYVDGCTESSEERRVESSAVQADFVERGFVIYKGNMYKREDLL